MKAVIGAFGFLTILPTGGAFPERPGRVFAWFPLVGLVIGLLLAATTLIPGLSPGLSAFAVLAVWVVLTGGLHLDGFSDACDGLIPAVEPARRLQIMRDSHVGTWAVVGLVLLLLGKWAALREVGMVAVIVVPVLGRWVMVMAAYGFDYARKEGLGGAYREGLGVPQVLVATVFAVAVVGWGTLFVDWRIALLAVAPVMVGFVGGNFAARQLGGGLTGDVYGALCELTEFACLITLAVM